MKVWNQQDKAYLISCCNLYEYKNMTERKQILHSNYVLEVVSCCCFGVNIKLDFNYTSKQNKSK